MNGLDRRARQSLDLLKLSPGQVIAVIGGAAGAYGGVYVVQLAKAEGLTVIADKLPRKTKSWLRAAWRRYASFEGGDDVASRICGHFPQGVDGLAGRSGCSMSLSSLPFVTAAPSRSVRGFQGIPQRGIHFHGEPLAALLRAGVREARSVSGNRSRPAL